MFCQMFEGGDPSPLLSPGETHLKCWGHCWTPQQRYGNIGVSPVKGMNRMKQLEHLMYEEGLR